MYFVEIMCSCVLLSNILMPKNVFVEFRSKCPPILYRGWSCNGGRAHMCTPVWENPFLGVFVEY